MADGDFIPEQQRASRTLESALPVPKLDFPEGAPRQITGEEDYATLTPGSHYIDPNGEPKFKPWRVTGEADYGRVPEGDKYIDPNGQLQTKAKYDPVDFTTETLYGMALNDKERRNALGRSYGMENVKEGSGDIPFYVEKEGKRYRPGKKLAGQFAANAAPIVGAVAGDIVGGAPGAAAGGGVGQGFNDIILGLTGVYDRSLGEEAGNLALQTALPGVGSVVGRNVTTAYNGTKQAAGMAKTMSSKAMAGFLGATADPSATEMAAALAAKGVKVPPSAWMKEAPYLAKSVEVMDPAFRTQNVLEQSAKDHYEKSAEGILTTLGVSKEDATGVTSKTAKPSSEEAGEAIKSKIGGEIKAQNDALAQAEEEARNAATLKAEGDLAARDAAISRLQQTATDSREAAQKGIDLGFQSIRDDVDKAITDAGVGGQPGDAFRAAADKVRTLRKAVGDYARKLYNAADAAAGDALPNVIGLAGQAKSFLESLPEVVRNKAPDLIQALERLASDEGAAPGASGLAGEAQEFLARKAAQEGGEAAVKEPITFGQLRHLRAMLRQDLDFNDLTPTMRDGQLKFFSEKIDDALHAGNTPELKTAAGLLDDADKFYADNIKQFKDEVVNGVVKATEAGIPPDPSVLAQIILQPGQAERIAGIKKIVGPGLWSAVQAADTKTMLDASQTLIPGEVDGQTFAKQVLDRIKNGILPNAYDKATAAKLRQQAEDVLAAGGSIPLAKVDGETVVQFMRRAKEAEAAATALAETNPMGALKNELGRIRQQFAANRHAVIDARKADPLAFVGEPTALASKAADKILSSPDLVMAAANRFGHDSAEFTMLRQVAARRMLQRTFDKTAGLGADMARWTPEVQNILFPGVSLADAQTLAKEMQFLALSGTDTGGSMMATSRIMHPISGLAGPLKEGVKVLGGFGLADAVGRALYTKYYALLSAGATHPGFVQWVAKGARAGGPSAAIVKTEFQKRIDSILGPMGAAAGADVGQNQEDLVGGAPGSSAPPPPRRSWRDQAGAR